jgi:cytochrome c-type biogenesis protein CcmH
MLSLGSSRRLSRLALVTVAIVALAYGSLDDGGSQTNEERAAALSTTIACPTCNGQSAADSNAPAALAIRAEVKRLIDEGRTNEEIRGLMVEAHGEAVDLSPSTGGLIGLVWIAPFLVIGVGVAALALAFSRWRAMSDGQRATPEDEAMVAEAQARLDDTGETDSDV